MYSRNNSLLYIQYTSCPLMLCAIWPNTFMKFCNFSCLFSKKCCLFRLAVSEPVAPVSDDDSSSGVDSEAGGDTPSLESSPYQRSTEPVSPPTRPPPDTDKIISMIQSLDSAATIDANVRETISQLPSDVTDTSKIAKITGGFVNCMPLRFCVI